MDTKRIESFKEFAAYIEYPMVVFEAETGTVLELNYAAEVLLGKNVQSVKMEPGRALNRLNFWEMLHNRKSVMWHRIRLFADEKEYLVSGLANEMEEDGVLIYTILFERRADLNIGSLTLEHIVEHAGIVAMHVAIKEQGQYQVEYVSRNINQYGYTRAQMYDKGMNVSDIICPEDFGLVKDALRRAMKEHVEESVVECRVITEERDLIPTKLLFHYIYDDAGTLTDYEILIVDQREDIRRNNENAYLSNAISKMKSVLLVKTWRDGKQTLKYISPNAGMVGMNVDALKKGYRLTQDYVHPEDRDSVISSVYQALSNGVTDYRKTFRMVRDDGRQIWVEGEVTVNRMIGGEAEVSFLLTDITEQKEIEKELAKVEQIAEKADEPVKAADDDGFDVNKTSVVEQFQLMAEALNHNADYCCVVLDYEGKLLTRPVGPAYSIGQFYDLFERPQLKQQLGDVIARAKEQKIPQSVSVLVGEMQVYMIFAPLVLHDETEAYWVLTSFDEDGDMKIGEVIELQWQLACSAIRCLQTQEHMQSEIRQRKRTEVQLHKEQQERQIIQDLIELVVRGGEASIGEMCHKIGLYLCVSDIGLYVEDKATGNAKRYFVWNQTNEDTGFFDAVALSVSEVGVLEELFRERSIVVADRHCEEPFLKGLLRQTGMKKIVFAAMGQGVDEWGYVVFADRSGENSFEEKEQHFIQTVVSIFERFTFRKKDAMKKDILRDGFFEAYDHISDAVFVKDNRTGEIVFTNKAMDKLFGYSLVGMQAGDVVNDPLEQYRVMQGIRKHFTVNRKMTKWQCYMKELDQIMNVVEIQMEFVSGAGCSLFILK